MTATLDTRPDEQALHDDQSRAYLGVPEDITYAACERCDTVRTVKKRYGGWNLLCARCGRSTPHLWPDAWRWEDQADWCRILLARMDVMTYQAEPRRLESGTLVAYDLAVERDGEAITAIALGLSPHLTPWGLPRILREALSYLMSDRWAPHEWHDQPGSQSLKWSVAPRRPRDLDPNLDWKIPDRFITHERNAR